MHLDQILRNDFDRHRKKPLRCLVKEGGSELQPRTPFPAIGLVLYDADLQVYYIRLDDGRCFGFAENFYQLFMNYEHAFSFYYIDLN